MASIPKPYRLLPKPIEASAWSNRAVLSANSIPAACAPPVSDRDHPPGGERCDDRAVGPTAEVSGRRRRPSVPVRKARFAPELAQVSGTSGSDDTKLQERRLPRKFVHQLIETSSRTRRATDAAIQLGYQDHTDSVTGQETRGTCATRRSRRSVNIERRRRMRSSAYSNASRMPDLETIVSSESEGSGSSAPPAVPHRTPRDHFTADLHDELDRYMLELEASRIQSKLQEQALAAFANSDFHEPIEHYVNLDDDAYDDRPPIRDGHRHEAELVASTEPFRREDTLVSNWDLLEMRQFHEALEQERNFMKTTAKRRSPGPSRSPFWRSRNASASSRSGSNFRTRNGARPPMLGQDIVFPRSDSPEPARLDVFRGSQLPGSSTCYLTDRLEASARLQLISADGLWGGVAARTQTRKESSRTGLWGGLCAGDEAPPNTGATTPIPEVYARGSPEDHSNVVRAELTIPADDLPAISLLGLGGPGSLAAPARRRRRRRLASAPDRVRLTSPPASQSDPSAADEGTDLESELERLLETEFPDSFVTQVFNYLSLGYPSLARCYDSELSKVTLIPLSELRSDDDVAESGARGYIRLGPDFESESESDGGGVGGSPTHSDFCRWRALKLYIRDWVRAGLERKWAVSAPGADDDGTDDGTDDDDDDDDDGPAPARDAHVLGVTGEHFGTAPRRGSWAW